MTIDEIVKQWLLTTAIKFPRCLGYIFPEVEGLALNMIEVPGCGKNEYAKALLALFHAGMIRFSSEESTHAIEPRADISKILDHLLSLDSGDPTARIVRYASRRSKAAEKVVRDPFLYVTFELTELGGKAWEKFAEPDWTRFLDQLTDITDEGAGEMTSPDLTLIMAYMGWFPPFADHQIKPVTVKVEQVADYPILYWKRLPHVYHATFEFKKANPKWQEGRIDGPAWFREWWHATTIWYKKPWELPGWPSSVELQTPSPNVAVTTTPMD